MAFCIRPAGNAAGCNHYFILYQMKFIKDNITPLLLAGIVIVLLFMLIRKKEPLINNDAVIKAKDQAIQAKQEFIEYLKEDNAWMDKHIQELKQRDSVLLARITANQPKYIANDKKYNDIPAAVNNLDKHQLRREFANY